MSGWYLKVFATARERPFEVDFGGIRVDTAWYGHRFLQGGSNYTNGAAAANWRICANIK